MEKLKILAGLPAYGPVAESFPPEWGKVGREGLVVQFYSAEGPWTANFKPGLGGFSGAFAHPDGIHAVAISEGDLWVVNPETRAGEIAFSPVFEVLEVDNPKGWVLNRQGIALARFGATGIMWHTRRLSWDGFRKLTVKQQEITGLAWSAVDEKWVPFAVELATGHSSGGAYSKLDSEGWERIWVQR